MEKAAENHPDRILIPQALADFKVLLSNINVEAGKAENIVRLHKLQKQIVSMDDDNEGLYLDKEGRQIIRDGKLIMKRGNDTEMNVFLFDHLFVVAKKKENIFKVARKVNCQRNFF